MLSIDTIRAKVSEKAKEKVGDVVEAIDNKIERDLLLTQRKWVDRTVFWVENKVNNRRLNRMEGIVGRTQGRVGNIDGDIEMAQRCIEAEMRILEGQKARVASKNRPTDAIEDKIANRKFTNENKIKALESRRKALLEVKKTQEKSKDSFSITQTRISNEMNDKINGDIELVEEQFNFKELKFKEAKLNKELEEMDVVVTEAQKERDQILADSVELEQHGRKLRESLAPFDAALKEATKGRNKVFAELSKISKRISSVEAKKAGWENFRTFLGVTKEAVPADRTVEAELMRNRSEKEQKARFKNSDLLKDFVAKQAPDSYTIDAAVVGDFFKDIRDGDGFDRIKPNIVRRGAEEMLIGKRKAENEGRLIALNENEKLSRLESEKDNLWEYVFQKLNGADSDRFIVNLVSGSDRRIVLNNVLNDQLRALLNNVGYVFNNKEEYDANINNFGRILLNKANERFVELMKKRTKDDQERFFRFPNHKDYINSLTDKVIQNDHYLAVEKTDVDTVLDQNGFSNIRYDDVADYINTRTEHLLNQIDNEGLLAILKKDKILIKLLKGFGYKRGTAPQAHEVNFPEFYQLLVDKGFTQLANDDRFKKVVMDCADRNMELAK